MLPDVLEENLLLVICGTAVAGHSAKVGSYYAGRGNKFWPTIHVAGLTDRCLHTEEFKDLLEYRVGLTDLVKTVAGTDDKLTEGDFDVESFKEKIIAKSPKIVCFNGKKAAETYLGKKVGYGLLSDTIGATLLFVAPSTSGAANRFWDLQKWIELGNLVAKVKGS